MVHSTPDSGYSLRGGSSSAIACAKNRVQALAYERDILPFQLDIEGQAILAQQ